MVGTGFGGRPTYRVWNERGDLLAEVVGPEEVGPTSVVDLEEGRLLLSGGGTVRAVDLEGQVRWELSLGELTFQKGLDGMNATVDAARSAHVEIQDHGDVNRWPSGESWRDALGAACRLAG